MTQPHYYALVVTLRIEGFLAKRVMINKRSGIEIVYSYLYKGLGLRDKDLTKYDIPLVGFVKKMVMPAG